KSRAPVRTAVHPDRPGRGLCGGWRVNLPIRSRLTAWFVVLLAVVMTALSGFLLVRLRADLVAGVDRSLDSRAAQISLGYQGTGEGEFQDVADASLVSLPQAE